MKVAFYADWFNELLLDEEEAKEWVRTEKANLMTEEGVLEEFFGEKEISICDLWNMSERNRQIVEEELGHWMENVAQSNFEDNFEKIVKEV